MALAAVDCHSSPAGAGREIGRVASFRAAALAMPARKSASLLALIHGEHSAKRSGEVQWLQLAEPGAGL